MSPIVPVLIGAKIAFAGGALLAHRSGRKAQGSVGRFVGQLHAGRLYRVWLRGRPDLVSSFHVEGAQQRLFALVISRLKAQGFSTVLLVTQDPSDLIVLTAIARWGGGTEIRSDLTANDFFVFHVEEVDDPDEAFVSPPPSPSPLLDLGLTHAEENAIKYALDEDENPKHLSGFADTLEPDFPIAAGLLGAKSKLSELRGLGALRRPERAAYAWEMRRRALAAVGWREEPEKGGAITTITSASEGLVSKDVWAKYEGDFPPPQRAAWDLNVAIRSPGADTSIAIVLPVGVPRSGNAEQLALGAFRDLHALARGNTIEEQADHYLDAMRRGEASSLKPKAVLVADLSISLVPRSSTMPIVRGVLAKLRAEPILLQRFPFDLARALGVPEAVAHAALASSRELSLGIVIVDADVLRGLDPGDEGRGRPFSVAAKESSGLVNGSAGSIVSSTALQLAYSAGRPTLSNVLRAPVAHLRMKRMLLAAKNGNPQALRAKASLDRASRLLQRQKWIAWYDRAIKTKASPRTQKLTGPLGDTSIVDR